MMRLTNIIEDDVMATLSNIFLQFDEARMRYGWSGDDVLSFNWASSVSNDHCVVNVETDRLGIHLTYIIQRSACMYRDRLKSVQIFLCRTQAGTGRKVKQHHDEISRNRVPSFWPISVYLGHDIAQPSLYSNTPLDDGIKERNAEVEQLSLNLHPSLPLTP